MGVRLSAAVLDLFQCLRNVFCETGEIMREGEGEVNFEIRRRTIPTVHPTAYQSRWTWQVHFDFRVPAGMQRFADRRCANARRSAPVLVIRPPDAYHGPISMRTRCPPFPIRDLEAPGRIRIQDNQKTLHDPSPASWMRSGRAWLRQSR